MEYPKRPFFGRKGGKTKLVKKINKYIPKDSNIYVEPFVGAGSVFLSKRIFDLEIINDKDKDIYHIWKDVKKCGEKISNMKFKPSLNKFENLKKEQNYKNNRIRLFRNLYISFFSFSQNRQDYIGGFAEKLPRYNRNTVGINLKKNCKKYKERLKNVKIYNQDYKKIIKKFDSKKTFFYLDPPYSYTPNDYKNFVTPIDVYNTVKNIKGKFLLSYDNSKEIRNIFKEYKIRKLNTTYKVALGKDMKKTELLISNY